MTPASSRHFDPVEALHRPEIERLQEARLLQLLPYAYARSALTRAVWDEAGVRPEHIRSLADFRERAPFIDKDAIRRHRDRHGDPFGGLLCAEPPHLQGVGFTSGTTGDPTPVARSAEVLSVSSAMRDLWHMGVRPGDTLVYMLFSFRDGHSLDRWKDAGYVPIQFQHSPDELPFLAEASRELKPTALLLLSTPLVLALEQLQDRIDIPAMFASYKGAFFGGEALTDRVRGLARGWGLELFEYCSLGDATGATECTAHDGMHTWEDQMLVEHLQPGSNEPVADGARGELVVTSLMDDVAPLVRYRSDDIVEFTRQPCRCGRHHGRMKPMGRLGDEMLIQGRSVLPREILPVVQAIKETEAGLFQVVRTSREADRLVVRVGHAPQALATSEAELIGRLTERLGLALGVPVTVQLRDNAELLKLGPPHKIPRVTRS